MKDIDAEINRLVSLLAREDLTEQEREDAKQALECAMSLKELDEVWPEVKP